MALAVKAGATSSQPTQRELEAIKRVLDRIQSELNRIQQKQMLGLTNR